MVSLAALPEETVAHIQSAGCKAQKKSSLAPMSAYCDRRIFAHRVLTATGALSPSLAVAPASTFLVLDPAAATCIY
jgi:hypothetical protein